MVIEIIKDDVLPDFEPLIDYHPAWLINSWTKQEYTYRLSTHIYILTTSGSPQLVCRALQLPSPIQAPPSLDNSGETHKVHSPQENPSLHFVRPNTSMADEGFMFATGMTPSLQIEDAGLAVQSDFAIYRLLVDMPMPPV